MRRFGLFSDPSVVSNEWLFHCPTERQWLSTRRKCSLPHYKALRR